MRVAAVALFTIACAVIGCGDANPSDQSAPPPDAMRPTATVDDIEITSARTVLPNGVRQQLTANGHKTDGSSEDVTRTVTWASHDPLIASVDDSGEVTAHAIGQTQITASRDGLAGSLTIMVTAVELTAISVSSGSPPIAKGLAISLAAVGIFSDGSHVELTTMVTWTTSDPAVATVSDLGVVQTLALGSTTISATIDQLTDSTVITVGPPAVTAIQITPDPLALAIGDSQQLSATSISSDGITQDVTSMATWTVSGTLVTVAPTGMVHAVNYGRAEITARIDGVSGTSIVNVAAPAVRLELSRGLANISIAQQQRVQFDAQLVFADDSIEDVTTTANWSSTDPTVASVVAGAIDAQTKVGTATITATARGFSQSIVTEVTIETCHPLINEVLGEGASPSDEWIELYNSCTRAIDVAGWTLVYHGPGQFDADHALVTLSGVMAPSEFRLYAGAGYTGTGAAAPDGVWGGGEAGILQRANFGVGLLAPTSSFPVDAVAFGTVISNPFLVTTAAPGLDNGGSGARYPFDGKNTFNGGKDFYTFIPSPKSSNPFP